MRYLLNKASLIVHDRESLRENCNTDQIKHKLETNNLSVIEGIEGHRWCKWCMGGR